MYRPYSSPVGGAASSMDVLSTIRGLTQDFSMNFNTGNYDQVAGLFASDGIFMAPHNESIVGPEGRSNASCASSEKPATRISGWKRFASIPPATWRWKLAATPSPS